MKLLITGGCGFVGSNLAAVGMKREFVVSIFDNFYRYGGSENLAWLRSQGSVEFIHGDIRNYNDVVRAIESTKPDLIFHLAGQVAMTTSLVDPRMDFEVNAVGTHNVLEAVRLRVPSAGILFASTNKVYGDLAQFRYSESGTRYECIERPEGFDEATPLDFHSPYGCSKGAADQYVRDYARMFSLRTVVFRHSSIYGGHQFSTVDQGWLGWFCEKAREIKLGGDQGTVAIAGSGKQVRDVLHVSDAADLYFLAGEKLDSITGEVFNVGGGKQNSLSVIELLDFLSRRLDISITVERGPQRKGDQRVFIADTDKASRMLGWQPNVEYERGIAELLGWLEMRYAPSV